MPSTVERREPGVYFLTWEGVITRDEMLEFIQERATLAEKHGDTHYVLIADLTSATMREYDIRTTRHAVEDPDLLATFVINPSMVIQTLINMLRQITRKPIEICRNSDEALRRARETLAQ
jgi:alkyl hydroperoxide reductase subunit AhpC